MLYNEYSNDIKDIVAITKDPYLLSNLGIPNTTARYWVDKRKLSPGDGFFGRNSFLFHLAGVLHPRLRTFLLLREAKNQIGGKVICKFSDPITSLPEFESKEKLYDWVQELKDSICQYRKLQ